MKRIISLLLCTVFTLSLCACKNTEVQSSDTASVPLSEIKYDDVKSISSGIVENEFDKKFMAFIEKSTEGNYMVSPLSFRYALGLLLSGADGETQTQLFSALGVKDTDEWTSYCTKFNGFVKRFYDELDEEARMYRQWGEDSEGGETDFMPKRAVRVANSVWKRQDIEIDFKPAYKKYISENYGAEYDTFTEKNAVRKINAWVNKKTEKLIPRLLSDNYDTENLAVVLMNALYFKDNWVNSFDKYATKEGDFKAKSGITVKKNFMEQTDHFDYYSDGKTEVVILPMENGVNMAFVLGDTSGIAEKVSKAKSAKVHVKIPKMDIETTFDKGEFINFLAENGVKDAFDRYKADFSKMIDHDIWVDDIIQKTKIKTDEEGVEAAAVTAIMTKDAAMMPDTEKPVEFIADRPFSFYIYTTCDKVTAMLFNGMMVE